MPYCGHRTFTRSSVAVSGGARQQRALAFRSAAFRSAACSARSYPNAWRVVLCRWAVFRCTRATSNCSGQSQRGTAGERCATLPTKPANRVHAPQALGGLQQRRGLLRSLTTTRLLLCGYCWLPNKAPSMVHSIVGNASSRRRTSKAKPRDSLAGLVTPSRHALASRPRVMPLRARLRRCWRWLA